MSYGALNRIDSAKYFIEQSVEIAKAHNDHHMVANAYFILGTIYSNTGNYSEAIRQYKNAEPHRKKIGNPFYIVADQYTLSDLYAKTGNYPLGIAAGLEGLEIATKHNLTLKFEGVYEALAKNYEGIGDFENASRYYQLWAVAKDSVYKNAAAQSIAEMKTKYESEKKEQLIEEQKLRIERNQIITIGILILFVLLVLVFMLWRKQLKLKQQQFAAQQQRESQERLTAAIVTLQESERNRFARDLHDGFGQLITALKLQIEKSGLHQGIPELVQHMHDEIRNVSFALSPQVLTSEGLTPALNELSFRINRSGKVLIRLQTTGLNGRLSSDIEINIYRICQEWINNVLKYNRATKIRIQLIDHSDELLLMIEDNGEGFDTSLLDRSKGNGWKT
ncbi:MAG: hypothetical protein HC811_14380 [Flammeovirgaceae bacterium]|nr:hypothetical protein [Flammeovirgaceae bacterium]